MKNFQRKAFTPLIRMIPVVLVAGLLMASTSHASESSALPGMVITSEKQRISGLVDEALQIPVLTVTASRSNRSSGGLHDYYSEGDYWWPDPDNPDGPYIRRDGESNPDNFSDHRLAMLALSDTVGMLASAYLLEPKQQYADRIAEHLNAWFVDEQTRMNPSLLYAQAIKGRTTGRSIGVIDTIHLAEVALATHRLSQLNAIGQQTLDGTISWFRQYLQWLNNHEFGITEREHPNNHSVAWSLQAAAFATLTGDERQLADIQRRFREIYVADMMAKNGSFTAELARTKPYGYSLFMMDLMAGIAALASSDDENLWLTDLSNGKSMPAMLGFIVPYIRDKDAWPYPHDVQHWNDWPARHAALALAGIAYDREDYVELWETLSTKREVFEVMRNLPLRNVMLWMP